MYQAKYEYILLPISRLAGRIVAYGTNNRKEEGNVLGGFGNLLDGRTIINSFSPL